MEKINMPKANFESGYMIILRAVLKVKFHPSYKSLISYKVPVVLLSVVFKLVLPRAKHPAP